MDQQFSSQRILEKKRQIRNKEAHSYTMIFLATLLYLGRNKKGEICLRLVLQWEILIKGQE